MRILQVNACDVFGGAERVARVLFEGFRARGHDSWLAVAARRSDWRDPQLIDVPNSLSILRPLKRISRFFFSAHSGSVPGAWRAARLFQHLSSPQRWLLPRLGRDRVWNPSVARLPDLLPEVPDILQCHTLYGYFDLRQLPALCTRTHVVLRPADAWLLTGHCSHPRTCERWMSRCGDCPDLKFPPAMFRDRTASNLEAKRRIFSRCQLHVVTPSRWIMDLVRQSVLAPAVLSSRVVHNGTDCSIFRPGDRSVVRDKLGLPHDACIVAMSATAVRDNACKDFSLAREALTRVSACASSRVVFLALGTDAPSEPLGRGELRFVPFLTDPTEVAEYLRASDIYLHATRADTFPNAVIEALACGLPVVANDVCGVPEQVVGIPPFQGGGPENEAATGALVPAGDAESMSEALRLLIEDPAIREQLGRHARNRAERLFDRDRQVDAYLDFYQSILDARKVSK